MNFLIIIDFYDELLAGSRHLIISLVHNLIQVRDDLVLLSDLFSFVYLAEAAMANFVKEIISALCTDQRKILISFIAAKAPSRLLHFHAFSKDSEWAALLPIGLV